MPDPGITIKIENKQPVELMDLTRSLTAFADGYKRFVTEHGGQLSDGDLRLYVNQIRSGSIVTDLVSKAAPYLLPFAENFQHIPEYIKFLKSIYDFLLGKTIEKPKAQRINYENCMQIMDPIAKDNGSQIFIQTMNFNAPVILNYNSLEANAIQNAARREMDLLKAPTTGFHSKVLLYWFQARNDTQSNVGDRAVIESVCSHSVKTIFGNEETKAKMLRGSDNPFRTAYIVDVAVETIADRPSLYKILDLHESFPKNET